MKNLIILFAFIASCTACFAQTFSLTVNLEGLRQEVGVVKICLMNDEQQFLEDCFVGKEYRFSDGERRRVVFGGVPKGEYAIMAYHDLDSNKKLNCEGLFGLPSEPYTFSNNPNTWFGPPKYRKCVFKVEKDLTVSLDL